MNNQNQPLNHNSNTIANDTRFTQTLGRKIPKVTFFNGSKIAKDLLNERNAILNLAHQYSLNTVVDMNNTISQLIAQRDMISSDIDKRGVALKSEISKLTQDRDELYRENNFLASEIHGAKQTIELESYGLYDYYNPAQDSAILSDELKEVRQNIKQAISSKSAAYVSSGFSFNNSLKQGKKFTDDMMKLMLKAYNAEAENAIKSIKTEKSVETAINRLNRTKDQVERLGKMIELVINEGFHQDRIREIQIASDYHKAVRAEKERAKEEADILREERKVEAELKKKQEELNKELRQKQIAMAQIEERVKNDLETLTEEEKESIVNLEIEINNIEKSLKEAEERAANLKAGYVYVISNVGSFGEGKVKIGMTRRVDPMERIKELGGASVPFGFDIHLLHYSENAMGVERKLHEIFANRRVNMVNRRREHFYANPIEVKEAILKLDGSITTFVEESNPEDFFESERMREAIGKNN